jgi:hypothetical protein
VKYSKLSNDEVSSDGEVSDDEERANDVWESTDCLQSRGVSLRFSSGDGSGREIWV